MGPDRAPFDNGGLMDVSRQMEIRDHAAWDLNLRPDERARLATVLAGDGPRTRLSVKDVRALLQADIDEAERNANANLADRAMKGMTYWTGRAFQARRTLAWLDMIS